MLRPESKIEFSQARRRAFIEEWLNFFMGRSNDLLSFEAVKSSLQLQDSSYRGLQEIELDKIVGSTGRYRDFTRTFLPKNDLTQQRWQRVDAVAHSGNGFPPIEVYKVGEVYFVRDGNHRVSVARAHAAKTIEAYVIEYKTSVPIDNQDDLDDILLKMEQAEFFETTRLDQLRPEQDIRFTEPGRYRLVKEHIAFHKYVREVECGCEISYEEAVGSWYDNVYLPLVQLIREREILKDFPGRTEADLYTWLIVHRAALEAEMDAMGQISDEQVIADLEKEGATPLGQLLSFFQDRLNVEELSLKAEQAQFLRETNLDQIRPAHTIQFTEPGGYRLVKEHIAFHKYLREIECQCEISYEEAVGSWFDNVYIPLIHLIRERGVQAYFPDCTEADLYLWLVLRRAALEQEMDSLGQIPEEKIIEDLEQETLPPLGPLTRLAEFFGFKPKPQRTTVTLVK
jgi:nuclear transport factor 2 (NTF2) superfamily protein